MQVEMPILRCFTVKSAYSLSQSVPWFDILLIGEDPWKSV